MRTLSPDQKAKLLELIRRKMGLDETATIIEDWRSFGLDLSYGPDLLVRDKNKLYIIDLVRELTLEKIATLRMLREMLGNRNKDDRVYAVAVTKKVLPSMERLSHDQGIVIIEALPDNRIADDDRKHYRQKTKLTAEKTWKIVARLLKEKLSTIRQVALKENVSYGLAHLAVKMLIDKGIVARRAGYLEVLDVKKLLNAIAWERPFDNLKTGEFSADFNSSYEAARNISSLLSRQGKPFAFTGLTAGSLYTGYAVRFDAVYLYLEGDDLEFLRSQLGSGGEGGIKVHVYSPDRDVFSDVRELESVTVVSPSQALLDLAGLGYRGMDMTNAMVDQYAGFH